MYSLIKRFFDIVFSFFALVLLLPLFIPIIIILKLTGEGEIFYKQARVGYKNKPFLIWKFATMLKNSASIGSKEITLRNDSRVTKFGKFLRISKLNELPQLINILVGEMSFVGPRPLMEVSFQQYSPQVQSMIYNQPPGLTGIGSLVFRDEELIVTQSPLSPADCYKFNIIPYKGQLEMWYQQKASLYTDLMILFLTAWSVIFSKSQLTYKVFKDLPKRSF